MLRQPGVAGILTAHRGITGAQRKTKMKHREEQVTAYLYIMPALLLMFFLTFLPNLYSLYIAFTNYSIFHFKSFEWVGWRNFITILSGPEIGTFNRVFIWTILWALLSVLGMVVLGLALAIPLNNKFLKGKNWFRTLLIIPWAIPAFISVLMWQGLLNFDFGCINTLLGYFGLAKVPWLNDPYWAKVSVLMVNIWLGFPFMMTISLGALQSVPNEIYEAAAVDGASAGRQFWAITLPLLRAAMLPALISSFAFNFNQFGSIFLLTRGEPPVMGSAAGATDILITYSYKLAFNLFRFGLACAYAVFIFVIIASLSALNFKLTGVFEETK